MQLTLLSGPRLIRRDWEYDESRGESAYVECEVTDRASRHLFDTITLDLGVTLRDIFLLLDADPVLQQVFAGDWAGDLLAEVLGGGAPAFPDAGYDPEGIEYLELYQVWELDSSNNELQPIHRLNFHGVGFLLKEDVVRDGRVDYRAGERIKWGVSFTSPLEMLHLPVRLDPEVVLCEESLDSVNHGKEVGRMRNPGVTLGQVMHGILWELSFHGSPKDRDGESAKIKALTAEVDSGVGSVTHRSTDLFSGYKATLAACFADTAGHPPDNLFNILQGIGDRENAETAFREKLGATVTLESGFCDMTGMELRAHVRRNSDITF